MGDTEGHWQAKNLVKRLWGRRDEKMKEIKLVKEMGGGRSNQRKKRDIKK